MSHMPWIDEDDETAILVKGEVGDDARAFIKLYNSMRQGRERTPAALFHRLVVWMQKATFSSVFVNALRACRNSNKKKKRNSTRVSKTTTVREEVEGFATISQICEMVSYTESWVRTQARFGRIKRRPLPSGAYLYCITDAKACVPEVRGGRNTSRLQAQGVKVSQRQLELPSAARPALKEPVKMPTAAPVLTAALGSVDKVDDVMDLLKRKLISPERAEELFKRYGGDS